jgi:hypothetical protein
LERPQPSRSRWWRLRKEGTPGTPLFGLHSHRPFLEAALPTLTDKHVAEKRDHTLVGLSIADRLASVASRLPGGGAGQTNECGRVIARDVGSDERADRWHEEGESVSLRARWANHYSARFGRTHLDERGGG